MDNALRALGRALAELGPAVLAIDDMHWAGADLWNALVAVADGFVRAGGLVVVAYRRPEIEATVGWAALQEWDRVGMLRVITLGPFGRDEVAELLSSGDAETDEVLAATGGIPFWVAQWAPGAAGEGDGDRLGLIRRRLGTLTTLQRTTLEGAAVLGERVPFGVWADVMQCSPIELAPVAEQLAHGRWIRPSSTGYEFVHDLIRVAVYDHISMPRRRSLHIRAATALARREPGNVRTRAYHLDRAGRRIDAAAMYRRAGEQYVATYAMREAVEAFARALELYPDDAGRDRLEVGLALAKACESVNDYDRQRPALEAVTALARESNDDAALLRATLIAGLAASRTGEPEASEVFLSQAVELAERTGDERGVIDATYLFADLRAQQGRWQAAEAAWRPVLEYGRRVDDLKLVGCVLRGLGVCAKQMGDPQAAVGLLEESLSALRRAGDRVNELYTSSDLLGVLYDLGAWDRLVAHADGMWPVADLFGDPVTAGVIRHLQGLGALALGDRATARTMMVTAREAFALAQRPRMVGLVINTIGLVAEDEGGLAEAERSYREALAIAEAHDAATEAAYARHDLGALLVRTGRPEEAVPLLRRATDAWAEQRNALLLAKSECHLALALLASGAAADEPVALADAGIALVRAGAPEGEQPQGWLWALTQLLDRLGRPADAAEALRNARAELDRQAQGISDADVRRQFFERVPLNRAIVESHARRSGVQATIEVELARADAPLGRALRDDERVCLQWTLYAPDDETIGDKGARRRHRLVRLLDEAATAGGAPTDEQLAGALGVSRRTILRDVELLGATRSVATTRRRAVSKRKADCVDVV
jgi:tetratricopeptide (TPR) repeat protein